MIPWLGWTSWLASRGESSLCLFSAGMPGRHWLPLWLLGIQAWEFLQPCASSLPSAGPQRTAAGLSLSLLWATEPRKVTLPWMNDWESEWMNERRKKLHCLQVKVTMKPLTVCVRNRWQIQEALAFQEDLVPIKENGMWVSHAAPPPSAALAIMPNDLSARGVRQRQLSSPFKLSILKRAETSIPHLFTDEETFPNRQRSHFFFFKF